MKFIGYTVVTIVVMINLGIYRGYALSVLWGWFAETTFSAPPLTIPAAISVSIISSFLTSSGSTDTNKEESYGEKLFKGTMHSVVRTTFALGFGWIVNFWM